MKKEREKKLNLEKITLQALDGQLTRDEQQAVNGGDGSPQVTVVPVFC